MYTCIHTQRLGEMFDLEIIQSSTHIQANIHIHTCMQFIDFGTNVQFGNNAGQHSWQRHTQKRLIDGTANEEGMCICIYVCMYMCVW